MHRGRRGRLSLLFLQRSASGGALRHREGVRPAGGMHPQKHSGRCLRGANQFPGKNRFPLGFWLGDGRGKWRWRATFVPPQAALCVWGSTTLPPVVQMLTYNLPDVKSCLRSEHTPSGPSAFASQTQGLCLAGGRPLHSDSFPPVRGARTASPPFLPSSVGLSSALGSRESVLLVFWRFSGLFRQVWVESK